MRNYVQPGEVVTLTAPAGGVKSGDGVVVENLFAVATGDAAEGESFEGALTGVYDLPKVDDQAWAVGDAIYFDPVTKLATTAASTNALIGTAVDAAANPSGTGRVRLDGARAAAAVAAAAQAAAAANATALAALTARVTALEAAP